MAFNFTPFPQLVTERLALRQLSIKDAEGIFELRTNEIVNRYLNRPETTSIDEAKRFIKKIRLGILANQWIFWAICLRQQFSLMGTICLWNLSEEESKAEIGYELLPRFHGKGIMQEALAKVVEFAFQTLELDSIEAWTTIQNKSSKKILERNFFRRDPILENRINREIEGAERIIYSLSKQVFNRRVAFS